MAFGFPARASETRTYDVTEAGLLQAAQITLDELGWPTKRREVLAIEARAGISLWSWGERVLVQVVGHEIEVESRCRGIQMFDWGKNRRNLDTFFERLDEVVEHAVSGL